MSVLSKKKKKKNESKYLQTERNGMNLVGAFNKSVAVAALLWNSSIIRINKSGDALSAHIS